MSDVFVIPGASYETSDFSILGFRTVLPDSTVTGDDDDPDYPIENALDYRDNTEFSPDSFSGAQEFIFEQSVLGEANYIGVLSKNAGDCELEIEVEIFDYATNAYVAVGTLTDIANGKPKLLYYGDLVDQGYYDTLKQRIFITSTSKAYITAIYIGNAIIFPYTPSLGFTPAHLNPQDEVENFRTHGNCRTIGRRIPNGKTAKGAINFIPMTDIDSYWPDYQEHALDSLPAFFAWSDGQMNQVIFGWQNVKSLAKPSFVTSFHGHLEFEINGYA